ncbi:hypothetical protein FPV67DRAFT_1670487 [Lyophyllum atratum]|nr:hypothetical protein FPV67DRAFT_1670487 [Lyophyllum atratum]
MPRARSGSLSPRPDRPPQLRRAARALGGARHLAASARPGRRTRRSSASRPGPSLAAQPAKFLYYTFDEQDGSPTVTDEDGQLQPTSRARGRPARLEVTNLASRGEGSSSKAPALTADALPFGGRLGAPRRISENPNPADLENVPSLNVHWNFLEEQDHHQPEGPSPQNIQLLQEELQRLQELQNSIQGAIDAYGLLPYPFDTTYPPIQEDRLDDTLPPDWGARTFQPEIQADQANRKAMMALYWAEMEDQSQARYRGFDDIQEATSYGAYFDHLAFPTAQGGAEVLEFRTPLEDPMVLADLLPYTRQMADSRSTFRQGGASPAPVDSGEEADGELET